LGGNWVEDYQFTNEENIKPKPLKKVRAKIAQLRYLRVKSGTKHTRKHPRCAFGYKGNYTIVDKFPLI